MKRSQLLHLNSFRDLSTPSPNFAPAYTPTVPAVSAAAILGATATIADATFDAGDGIALVAAAAAAKPPAAAAVPPTAAPTFSPVFTNTTKSEVLHFGHLGVVIAMGVDI
ncbi:hypothetical protein ACMFLR_22380 [Delftia tsuruhatensis]|uniref:hypothetical protein n=1 Tax=Delftia TaxID=80865 RepID=UPI0012E01219|nr:hypothetical protein [Delftia sp. ZNC0008]